MSLTHSSMRDKVLLCYTAPRMEVLECVACDILCDSDFTSSAGTELYDNEEWL